MAAATNAARFAGWSIQSLLEQVQHRLPQPFTAVRPAANPRGSAVEFVRETSTQPAVTVAHVPGHPGGLRLVVGTRTRPDWGEVEIRRYSLKSGLFLMLILATHLTFAIPVAFLVLDPLGIRRWPDTTGGILPTLLLISPILIYIAVALWIFFRAVKPRWETVGVILDAEGRNTGESWTAQGDMGAARLIMGQHAVRETMERRHVSTLAIRGSDLTMEAILPWNTKGTTGTRPNLQGLAVECCDLAAAALSAALTPAPPSQ